MVSASRLVATTLSFSQPWSSTSMSDAAAGSTCSQLSSISSVGWLSKRAVRLCSSVCPFSSRTPSDCATARHLGDIRDRSQIDEPHAADVLLEQARHELERQARLAVAAGSGQREQSGLPEQPVALLELLLAAHEARDLARQVVERAGGGHQLGGDPGDLLLEQ